MKSKIKCLFLAFSVLLLLLIPYFILESIENWTNNFLNSSSPKLLVGLIIGGLLCIDIISPVPSSIVSTAGGYFLGFILGTLVSLAGMTTSCIISYWIGAKFGNPVSERLVGVRELKKLETLQNKYGK